MAYRESAAGQQAMQETNRKLEALESIIDAEFGREGDDGDRDGFFCEACNKTFKSQKQ